MTQITLSVRGAELMQSGLSKLALAVSNFPTKLLKPELEQAAKEATGNYPGGAFGGYDIAPPFTTGGPAYTRTGAYGRGTGIEQSGRGYRLVSRAPHARYVGGGAFGGQAWMHASRWPSLVSVVEKAVDRVVQKARELFNRELTGGGGFGL
jgi:hypothetical protein